MSGFLDMQTDLNGCFEACFQQNASIQRKTLGRNEMIWLMLLTLLGISLVCAFYGTSLLLWTAAMAAGIFIFAVTGSVPVLSLVLVAAVFAVIAVPLNLRPWRQQLISAPFLKQFRRLVIDQLMTVTVARDFMSPVGDFLD